MYMCRASNDFFTISNDGYCKNFTIFQSIKSQEIHNKSSIFIYTIQNILFIICRY